MAAVITEPIPYQSFEIIRDRLAEIINDELQNQIALGYLTEFDSINVFLERWVNLDVTEMPCVVINMAPADFENMKPLDLTGNYFFNIDCYANAAATESTYGDDEATFKVHRILGMVRAIVMSPHYITLGFERGFISRVQIDSMPVVGVQSNDAENVIRGRLVAKIQAAEVVAGQEVRLSTGHTTKLILGSGGYNYELNNT